MSKHATALVRCASYDHNDVQPALDQALALIGGLSWVQKGMRIVVKPNLLMRKHPDSAATTHPALMEALITRLLEKGAQVVIGESPGGPFSEFWLRTVYEGTQMTRLVREGVTLNYDTAVLSVPNPEGSVLKTVDVAKCIMDADAVISFAKLKTHTFMNYTGAVKNLFGVVPGTVKAEYHQRMADPDRFARMLVDIAEFVQPRLSIIDGVVGMEGNGPSGGNPRHVGAIVASASPHHADLVGTALMGLDPREAPTLKDAINRGLCPASVKDIGLLGENVESLAVPDYKMPDHVRREFKFGAKVFRMIFQSDPVVNKSICVGCAECFRACPPKAIRMVEKAPQFDRKACIHCFCCQELCPQTAIYLRRGRLARWLQKSPGQDK